MLCIRALHTELTHESPHHRTLYFAHNLYMALVLNSQHLYILSYMRIWRISVKLRRVWCAYRNTLTPFFFPSHLHTHKHIVVARRLHICLHITKSAHQFTQLAPHPFFRTRKTPQFFPMRWGGGGEKRMGYKCTTLPIINNQ